MTSQDDQSNPAFEPTQIYPQLSDTQETITHGRANSGGAVSFNESTPPSRKSSTIALIGNVKDLPIEERETLRERLLAATLVILFGFAIYLVRSYFDNRPLQRFHTFVVFSLMAAAGVLTSRRELSTKDLRYLFIGSLLFP